MSVTIYEHTCPNCGGEFILSVGSQYAQCENCGNTASVDADELLILINDRNKKCKVLK